MNIERATHHIGFTVKSLDNDDDRWDRIKTRRCKKRIPLRENGGEIIVTAKGIGQEEQK